VLHVYVSCENMNDIDVNDFISIDETYNSQSRKYVTGLINFDKLRNASWLSNPSNSLVVFEDTSHLEHQHFEELE